MAKTDSVELHTYPVGTPLPSYFYYQMESFSRIVWGEDPDECEAIDAGLDEPVHHFIIAQGKRLISYASVSYVELELHGIRYLCGGLGGVMTFPAFRKRGYGSRVVGLATDAILNHPNTDIGLLWTDPKNDDFYQRYGWKVMPNLITTVGNPPVVYENEQRMMLFASEKGKHAHGDFANGRVYVGQDRW